MRKREKEEKSWQRRDKREKVTDQERNNRDRGKEGKKRCSVGCPVGKISNKRKPHATLHSI